MSIGAKIPALVLMLFGLVEQLDTINLQDRVGEKATSSLPGYAASGISGAVHAAPHDLSLQLSGLTVTPTTAGNYGIEFVIVNVGSTPFPIPTSLDHLNVLRDGCKDRRDLIVSVVFDDPGLLTPRRIVIEAPSTSRCDRGSMYTLAPHRAVKLQVSAQRGMVGELEGHAFHVEVAEQRYSEKAFIVSSTTETRATPSLKLKE